MPGVFTRSGAAISFFNIAKRPFALPRVTFRDFFRAHHLCSGSRTTGRPR
jgi:hypothetical protein